MFSKLTPEDELVNELLKNILGLFEVFSHWVKTQMCWDELACFSRCLRSNSNLSIIRFVVICSFLLDFIFSILYLNMVGFLSMNNHFGQQIYTFQLALLANQPTRWLAKHFAKNNQRSVAQDMCWENSQKTKQPIQTVLMLKLRMASWVFLPTSEWSSARRSGAMLLSEMVVSVGDDGIQTMVLIRCSFGYIIYVYINLIFHWFFYICF